MYVCSGGPEQDVIAARNEPRRGSLFCGMPRIDEEICRNALNAGKSQKGNQKRASSPVGQAGKGLFRTCWSAIPAVIERRGITKSG